MATIVNEIDEVAVVDSVESLFRSHYGRLVRALTLASGNPEAAADAVQEAFVKAHLHWRRIQRYDDPVGWIRRVAINKMRDQHRSQSRKDKAVEKLGNQLPDAHHDEFDDVSDYRKLLAQLPRQQRLAIALFYVEGLSVEEVANALDISEGAVKFHLHQGRQKLRAAVTVDVEAAS